VRSGDARFLKGLGMAGTTLLPASALLVTGGGAQQADLMAGGASLKERKNGGRTDQGPCCNPAVLSCSRNPLNWSVATAQ
jgi:hypothetical protein